MIRFNLLVLIMKKKFAIKVFSAILVLLSSAQPSFSESINFNTQSPSNSNDSSLRSTNKTIYSRVHLTTIMGGELINQLTKNDFKIISVMSNDRLVPASNYTLSVTNNSSGLYTIGIKPVIGHSWGEGTPTSQYNSINFMISVIAPPHNGAFDLYVSIPGVYN